MVASHVETAGAEPEPLTVWTVESVNLPRAERRETERVQADYVDQWIRLVGTVAPGVAGATARVRAHAAIVVASDLPRTGLCRCCHVEDISSLATRVL